MRVARCHILRTHAPLRLVALGGQRRECFDMSRKTPIRESDPTRGHYSSTFTVDKMAKSAEPLHRQRGMSFLDRITFLAKAGSGGAGGVFWRHFYNNAWGGPGGGNGGDGGSVKGQCTAVYDNLMHLVDGGFIVHDEEGESHIGICSAGKGVDGDREKMGSANGHDIVIPIPLGTVVIDADTGKELVEFKRVGEMYTFAEGGRGGRGNAALADSVNKAPDYSEEGTEGESRLVTLELRVFADVGLVGTTNSGKSSLMGSMSRGAPRPHNMFDTTWRPYIGHVYPDESSSFSIVDLPPVTTPTTLREGRDYDPSFLRHLTRCPMVVYVLESCHARITPNGTHETVPLHEALRELQEELEMFEAGLSHKAVAVVITKMDILHDVHSGEETWKKVEDLQERTNLPVFPVSAHSKKGVLDLALFLAKLAKKHRDDAIRAETDRTRRMREERDAYGNVRYAEYKQVVIRGVQDFHLSSAVGQILQDRIRGRPSFTAEHPSRVDAARARVHESQCDPYPSPPPPSGSTSGVMLLECTEASTDEVYVDDREHSEPASPVVAIMGEDWDVGTGEDVQEEQRATAYSEGELWSPLHLEASKLEERKREESYEITSGIDTTVKADTEFQREEYLGEKVGRYAQLSSEAVKALASAKERRNMEMEEAVKEGRAPVRVPPVVPLPSSGDAPPPLSLPTTDPTADPAGWAEEAARGLGLGKSNKDDNVELSDRQRRLQLAAEARRRIQERAVLPTGEVAQEVPLRKQQVELAAKALEIERDDNIAERDRTFYGYGGITNKTEKPTPEELASKKADLMASFDDVLYGWNKKPTPEK